MTSSTTTHSSEESICAIMIRINWFTSNVNYSAIRDRASPIAHCALSETMVALGDRSGLTAALSRRIYPRDLVRIFLVPFKSAL
ncbi:MAG: hypothetical protein ACE5R6_00240 [Candidatus Heimdallarchaeota archaeon]